MLRVKREGRCWSRREEMQRSLSLDPSHSRRYPENHWYLRMIINIRLAMVRRDRLRRCSFPKLLELS